MVKFVTLDNYDFPLAFYAEDVHGLRKLPVYGEVPAPSEENLAPEAPMMGERNNPDCLIPVEAIEITDAHWSEFLEHQGRRKWKDGEVIEYLPPEPEPQPVVIVVPALTLWERMTNQEAERVNEAMASQPFRIRQIFLTAPTFRSDHELWPLLEQIATELFGEIRAAELLAG